MSWSNPYRYGGPVHMEWLKERAARCRQDEIETFNRNETAILSEVDGALAEAIAELDDHPPTEWRYGPLLVESVQRYRCLCGHFEWCDVCAPRSVK